MLAASSCRVSLPPITEPGRQLVYSFGIGNPVSVVIGLQLLRHAHADFLPYLGIDGRDYWRSRRSGQMIQYELLQSREVNVQPSDANLHIGECRLRCKPL